MHALADSELCDVSRTPLDVMLTLLDVIRFDSVRFMSFSQFTVRKSSERLG